LASIDEKYLIFYLGLFPSPLSNFTGLPHHSDLANAPELNSDSDLYMLRVKSATPGNLLALPTGDKNPIKIHKFEKDKIDYPEKGDCIIQLWELDLFTAYSNPKWDAIKSNNKSLQYQYFNYYYAKKDADNNESCNTNELLGCFEGYIVDYESWQEFICTGSSGFSNAKSGNPGLRIVQKNRPNPNWDRADYQEIDVPLIGQKESIYELGIWPTLTSLEKKWDKEKFIYPVTFIESTKNLVRNQLNEGGLTVACHAETVTFGDIQSFYNYNSYYYKEVTTQLDKSYKNFKKGLSSLKDVFKSEGQPINDSIWKVIEEEAAWRHAVADYRLKSGLFSYHGLEFTDIFNHTTAVNKGISKKESERDILRNSIDFKGLWLEELKERIPALYNAIESAVINKKVDGIDLKKQKEYSLLYIGDNKLDYKWKIRSESDNCEPCYILLRINPVANERLLRIHVKTGSKFVLVETGKISNAELSKLLDIKSYDHLEITGSDIKTKLPKLFGKFRDNNLPIADDDRLVYYELSKDVYFWHIYNTENKVIFKLRYKGKLSADKYNLTVQKEIDVKENKWREHYRNGNGNEDSLKPRLEQTSFKTYKEEVEKYVRENRKAGGFTDIMPFINKKHPQKTKEGKAVADNRPKELNILAELDIEQINKNIPEKYQKFHPTETKLSLIRNDKEFNENNKKLAREIGFLKVEDSRLKRGNRAVISFDDVLKFCEELRQSVLTAYPDLCTEKYSDNKAKPNPEKPLINRLIIFTHGDRRAGLKFPKGGYWGLKQLKENTSQKLIESLASMLTPNAVITLFACSTGGNDSLINTRNALKSGIADKYKEMRKMASKPKAINKVDADPAKSVPNIKIEEPSVNIAALEKEQKEKLNDLKSSYNKIDKDPTSKLLYSYGGNPESPELIKNTMGKGSFAEKLCLELSKNGIKATVWSHTDRGHTSRNARLRLFYGNGNTEKPGCSAFDLAHLVFMNTPEFKKEIKPPEKSKDSYKPANEITLGQINWWWTRGDINRTDVTPEQAHAIKMAAMCTYESLEKDDGKAFNLKRIVEDFRNWYNQSE